MTLSDVGAPRTRRARRRAPTRAVVAITFAALALAAATSTPVTNAYRSFAGNDTPRRVLLRDIDTLTFTKGAMTTGRRSRPVPQMECAGGDACWEPNAQPEVMQCKLEDYYRLGSTTVSCEGYDYPDDPYILAGSCGVRYSLHLTSKGRARRDQRRGDTGKVIRNPRNDDESSISGFLMFIGIVAAMFGFAKLVAVCAAAKVNDPDSYQQGPPPPYPGAYEPVPQGPGAGPAGSGGPGFGAGLAAGAAAGAAAGYMAGHAAAAPRPWDRSWERQRERERQWEWDRERERERERERVRERERERERMRRERSPSPPRTYTSEGYGGTERR
ncbi:hypothetical protein AMAG_00014 [Allomyces macrogynus ATCC 38327]|uniref:Store-operated calcium entry-associated regulatory factor n=1 Tax=Allomyces macrogynus (strain ATCC 38327) TaxID=578462 RepID=A0A0L0RUT8_ALLM3|nr:hypothetical protein AMAG_00014 [Allomyces macrogynus ATCC 38327]|eukprot:KNE54018.1 hypothetical protein AMAG_00014 [Allomyces macrogynus ATCC 38327]